MSLKRNPRMQARLDAWGRWLVGGGGGRGSSPLATLMHWEPNQPGMTSSFVPVDEIECSITDDAIRQLPAELRLAVTAWHGPGAGTMEQVAQRLGIVKATLWKRLAQADARLQEWFDDRRELARARGANTRLVRRVMRDKPDRA